MNLISMVIAVLLAAAVIAAYFNAMKHKHSCGGCSGCSGCDGCRKSCGRKQR